MRRDFRHKGIHPFPARMAPDVATQKIVSLTRPGEVILDPMCGSGTVPRLALNEGRVSMACDLDPLAVAITRTVCTPSWCVDLAARAEAVVKAARRLRHGRPAWIQDDPESVRFVDYWFAEEQREALGRLARVLAGKPRSDDPLRIALSRLIVTKEGGASLARDTSHSRPHRVRDTTEYDVFREFLNSARRIQSLSQQATTHVRASVRTADARRLHFIAPHSVDCVVTSPPYLNAIDYLRGHRMSLVWLGWQLRDLKSVRGESIGAERALLEPSNPILTASRVCIPQLDQLPIRNQRMIFRFTRDINSLCRSLSRVIRPNGYLVFVVADSLLRGIPVSNSGICSWGAEGNGFKLEETVVRNLPAQHRYLPPPDKERTALSQRMREERVMTFMKMSHAA